MIVDVVWGTGRKTVQLPSCIIDCMPLYWGQIECILAVAARPCVAQMKTVSSHISYPLAPLIMTRSGIASCTYRSSLGASRDCGGGNTGNNDSLVCALSCSWAGLRYTAGQPGPKLEDMHFAAYLFFSLFFMICVLGRGEIDCPDCDLHHLVSAMMFCRQQSSQWEYDGLVNVLDCLPVLSTDSPLSDPVCSKFSCSF